MSAGGNPLGREGGHEIDNEIVRVGDVMSPTVRMIQLTATVAEALSAMRDAGVSSLVVEDRKSVV